MESVAFVTGASRGIGKAIASKLAKHGAYVVLASRNEELSRQVCDEIAGKGGRALHFACDIRNENEVRDTVEKAVARLGRIDVLVNNAGIGKSVGPVWETPTELWDDTMAVNLRGTFLCCKYALPHMIEQRSGRVINIASVVGRQARPFTSSYSASKAGVISLTVALAKEAAAHGITVNAVCPSPVETDWWNDSRPIMARRFNVPESEVINAARASQYIKSALTADEVANVVYWLTTDDTRMITGQAIGIDGGHEFPTY